VRCAVRWERGEMKWAGRTKIWFAYKDGWDLWWYYAYRITRVNKACVAAGNRHCVRHYVVY